MLDLARARYFLVNAGRRNAADLVTIAHLYNVAKLQWDRREQFRLGTEILQMAARTRAQRELQAEVAKDIEPLGMATPPELVGDPTRDLDPDELRQLVGRQLAAGRPELAKAQIAERLLTVGRLPGDLVHRLASLCLFLGAPGFGLEGDRIEGAFDEQRGQLLRASAELVRGSLRSSIAEFQLAIESDAQDGLAWFGLARAHLELGNATSAYVACTRALNLPELSDEQRHQVEWMAELTRPFARQQ
jgi:hypothetical protein